MLARTIHGAWCTRAYPPGAPRVFTALKCEPRSNGVASRRVWAVSLLRARAQCRAVASLQEERVQAARLAQILKEEEDRAEPQ